MNKVLFFLFTRGFFRSCIFILKVKSIFKKKFKKEISFYRYFKKKKNYKKKEILKIIYQPKIFIFNFPYQTKKLINKIYNYEMLYLDNQKINDGHRKVYQSKDNLNIREFNKISSYMEKFINKNISKYLQNKKLKLIKMWIVITKNLGIMKKHSHFNSDFSGVLYVRVDNNKDYKGGLKIYNVLKNIEIYHYSRKKKLFIKSINRKQSFIIKPKRNDLVIFNSYIEHSVQNKNSKIIDRISLPFDMVF